MEIIAIIILALIVAAFAVYALRNGTKSSVPPVSVEVEAEKMRLASEVERLQAAEVRANELQVHTVALERDLENERALLKKLEEEHRVKDKKVEELTQQIQQASTKNATLSEQLESKTNSIKDALQRVRNLESETKQQQDRIVSLTSDKTKLEGSLKDLNDRLEERAVLEKRFAESFKALSSDTLAVQGKRFMENADANLKEREAAVEKLVKPLTEKIDRFEVQRSRSEGELGTQIKELSVETMGLRSALRRPEIRGQWGEIQLERVLELSGLRRDIDFTIQDSFSPEGGRQRTDVIIRMPKERTVVLDSKVSLAALMDASTTEDEDEKRRHYERHVEQVKNHVKTLADKEYWKLLSNTPDIVVMVLPEFAFLAALEREPSLVEDALKQNVIIVTPPAVLALLRAVELNWQQIKVAETAQQISQLGRELYDDLRRYRDNYARVGRGLLTAVNGFNTSVGTFERNVLRKSQKFQELGVTIASEIDSIPEITTSVRDLRQLPEHDNGSEEPDPSNTNSDGHALSEGSDVNNGSSDLSDDGRELDSRLAQAFSSDDALS